MTRTPKAPIIITAVTGLAAGALATAGVFLATSDTSTDHTDQIAQCVTALELSDQAIDLYSDTLNLAADSLGAYERNDYRAMDRHTASIRDNGDQLTPLLTDYYLAQTACLQD